MLGDGATQGRPVSSQVMRAAPALHYQTVKLAVLAPAAAPRLQAEQLAEGEAVAHRQAEGAHERLDSRGCGRLPSTTTPPSGLGRSSTQTSQPAAIAASAAQIAVAA